MMTTPADLYAGSAYAKHCARERRGTARLAEFRKSVRVPGYCSSGRAWLDPRRRHERGNIAARLAASSQRGRTGGQSQIRLRSGLEISDIGVFRKAGRAWATLPAELQRDYQTGQPLRDEHGKR